VTSSAAQEYRAALSRDGRRLAFNLWPANEKLYYMDLATGREREIPFAGYRAADPIFSPDGATNRVRKLS
jgi:Tol biopolymer transport system component